MNTAIKHTTNTQLAASRLEHAKNHVLQVTGMGEDELFELKLGIGLKFARQCTKMFITGREDIYTNLTTNPDWNYWNWWNLKWSFDDAALIQIGCLDEDAPYEHLKEAMLGDDVLMKDLYWMIQQYTDLC